MWRTYPSKVTTWCRQILRRYQVYMAAWPWTTLKVQKVCIKINIKLGRNSNVEKIPVKLQHGTCNFRVVIAFTRLFDIGLYWKFKKVTQRSTSNMTEILMRRTSLPIKLQHDAGKFWGIIKIHKELQNVAIWTRSSSKGQKVRQRSKLKSSEILMWRISL